jgi:(2Fe-2S) ferredoxin
VPINPQNDASSGLVEGAISQKLTARTGIISHIGGHKFAGNVIIYVPKKAKAPSRQPHPLAGCGIWYGRVEPRHVECIVTRTILNGEVIEDLFRGGITKDSEILRL